MCKDVKKSFLLGEGFKKLFREGSDLSVYQVNDDRQLLKHIDEHIKDLDRPLLVELALLRNELGWNDSWNDRMNVRMTIKAFRRALEDVLYVSYRNILANVKGL